MVTVIKKSTSYEARLLSTFLRPKSILTVFSCAHPWQEHRKLADLEALADVQPFVGVKQTALFFFRNDRTPRESSSQEIRPLACCVSPRHLMTEEVVSFTQLLYHPNVQSGHRSKGSNHNQFGHHHFPSEPVEYSMQSVFSSTAKSYFHERDLFSSMPRQSFRVIPHSVVSVYQQETLNMQTHVCSVF